MGFSTSPTREWIRWARCLLPPICDLPSSSLCKSIAKFAGGSRHDDWRAHFTSGDTSAQSIIALVIQWCKWTDRNDAHMFAAFDCALIANRVNVLSLWWELTVVASLLPFRTGLDPQPELPLALSVKSGAFNALVYTSKNLPSNHPSGSYYPDRYYDAFDSQLVSEDLTPLLKYPADSRESCFRMDWILTCHNAVDCTWKFMLAACEFGCVDVLAAIGQVPPKWCTVGALAG